MSRGLQPVNEYLDKRRYRCTFFEVSYDKTALGMRLLKVNKEINVPFYGWKCMTGVYGFKPMREKDNKDTNVNGIPAIIHELNAVFCLNC